MKNIVAFFKEDLWKPLGPETGGVKRFGIQTLRFFARTFCKFNSSHCELHAASLTYFTLLTAVPIMCLVLLLAKTCGFGEAVRDKMNGHFNEIVVTVCPQESVVEEAAAPDRAEEDTPVKESEPAAKQEDSAPVAIQENPAPAATQDNLASEVAQENPAPACEANAAPADAEATQGFARQMQRILNGLFDRIDRFDVSTLGWIGLVMLIWSIVSTLGKVEVSFNEIWDVPRPRSLPRKLVLYVLASVILPLLVSVAASMPILKLVRSGLEFLAVPGFKPVVDFLNELIGSEIFGRLISFIFASAAMSFFLAFIPYTKVNLKLTVIGGALTAAMFLGWLKLCAMLGIGIAKTSAIYGSFAFLPIVLAWIYMSWQIILLGACALRAMHLAGTDRR